MASINVGGRSVEGLSSGNCRALRAWGIENEPNALAVAGRAGKEGGVAAAVFDGELLVTTKTPMVVSLASVVGLRGDRILLANGSAIRFIADNDGDHERLASALASEAASTAPTAGEPLVHFVGAQPGRTSQSDHPRPEAPPASFVAGEWALVMVILGCLSAVGGFVLSGSYWGNVDNRATFDVAAGIAGAIGGFLVWLPWIGLFRVLQAALTERKHPL